MKKVLLILIAAGVVIYAAYEALMFYDNEFRYGRMRETPAVRPHEEPLLIMATGVVPVSGGEMHYRTQKPDDLKSPLEMKNPETINRCQAVYFNYCAQCHGKNHNGNGTVGQSFAPLPTDLRSAKVQDSSAGVLFKNVSYGVPDGRQPPLHATITADDRWRVISYVKSLGVRK